MRKRLAKKILTSIVSSNSRKSHMSDAMLEHACQRLKARCQIIDLRRIIGVDYCEKFAVRRNAPGLSIYAGRLTKIYKHKEK